MDLVPAPAVRLMKSGSEENYSMRSEFLSIFSSPFYDNSLFFFFANLLFHYLLKIILQISFFHGFAVLFLSLKKLVLSSAFSISGAASFVSKKSSSPSIPSCRRSCHGGKDEPSILSSSVLELLFFRNQWHGAYHWRFTFWIIFWWFSSFLQLSSTILSSTSSSMLLS